MPDESTGSSIVTVINYSDRIDANSVATTITSTTEHTSPIDNYNRRSEIFEPTQRNTDNNTTTNAIETSIKKCIQATKSLSIQSNDSPAASPPNSSTLNAIANDNYYMGSGTKNKQCKNQFLNEPCRFIIITYVYTNLECFFFNFWPQRKKTKCYENFVMIYLCHCFNVIYLSISWLNSIEEKKCKQFNDCRMHKVCFFSKFITGLCIYLYIHANTYILAHTHPPTIQTIRYTSTQLIQNNRKYNIN